MNGLAKVKSEKFGAVVCDFWKNESGEIFMTTDQLGRALGYSEPVIAINKLVARNPYLASEEFSTITKLVRVEGNREVARDVRIFTEDGIYEVTFLSGTEKAKEFRAWVRQVLKSLRSGQLTLIPDLSKLSPELQMFNHMFNAVVKMELRQKQLENQITEIKDTIVVRDNNWRTDAVNKLRKIGFRTGGYKEITNESYRLLEERAGCSLDVRLENLKKRMAQQGARKSDIDRTNYLDVIEADKRLREIYINIVNQLYIKYIA